MGDKVSGFELANRGKAEDAERQTSHDVAMQRFDANIMRSARFSDEGMQVGPFMLKRDSLDIGDEATPEQWLELGKRMDEWDDAVQWWIGDWAYHAHHAWGISYEDISKKTKLFTLGTIKNCASVTSRVLPHFRPQSLRNDWLKWNHYVELVKVPESKFEALLYETIDRKLTVRALREKINPSAKQESLAIADRQNKRVFNRLWRAALAGGQGLKRDDIARLRRWLDELERGDLR